MNEENASPEDTPERTIIPQGTVAVTIGADSQSDGFYYLLACWGRKMECWLPLTGRFVGDMRSHEVWDALSGVLGTEWLDREGNLYRPICSAIDVQGDHYLKFLNTSGLTGSRVACMRFAATGEPRQVMNGLYRYVRNPM